MAIQFMFSPDGIDLGNATSALRNRGAIVGSVSDAFWQVQDIEGKKWFGQNSNSGENLRFPAIRTQDATMGFRVRNSGGVTAASGDSGQAVHWHNDNRRIQVRLMSNGDLYLRTYGFTSNLGVTIASAITEAYVEVEVAGTALAVYLNGSDDYIYSATLSNAPSGVQEVTFNVATYQVRQFLRDIYLAPERQGETEVRLSPSNSASTTGTLVGGTAEEAVDLDTAAAYASLESGQTLTSNVGGSITDNPQSIKAVQVTSLARKSGTALLPEKVVVTTPAGTQEIEPAIPLGLGFGAQSLVMATDPNDNAAWTKAKVNGLTVGGKG